MIHRNRALLSASLLFTIACGNAPEPAEKSETPGEPPKPIVETATAALEDTCSATYPSYWQDPDPKFAAQWEGQTISNAPPPDWQGPTFRLSDKYPRTPVDDRDDQPWRDSRFDPMFQKSTPTQEVRELAKEYAWLVMTYIRAGNINQPGQQDWDVCKNPIRQWFHIPFQTYDALSGREFTRGLTREAPVTFSTKVAPFSVDSTMWAIGLFNATAAYTLGQVWQADGSAQLPTSGIEFKEGSVIGKPLFNTSTVDELPILKNMPAWNANISATNFCRCHAPEYSEAKCTLVQESQQCPRSTDNPQVRHLQFDFAVKDKRAPNTQWVFGTFAADGLRKASEPDPWKRISLLGVMWGNDTPPDDQLAHDFPADPRLNGFGEAVIFWDLVDELNSSGGNVVMQQPGHLGCNYRLSGPADNANSSCMSCHGTASVPDQKLESPPLLAQFTFGKITPECVTPDGSNPNKGADRSGKVADVVDGVSFAGIDSLYFANTEGGAPFNTTVETPAGPFNVMAPSYANSQRKDWISTDYSLQLSISLTQWAQWQRHQAQNANDRVHTLLRQRGR